MTSYLKTLQITCQEFYSQWRHNSAAPSRVLWTNVVKPNSMAFTFFAHKKTIKKAN